MSGHGHSHGGQACHGHGGDEEEEEEQVAYPFEALATPIESLLGPLLVSKAAFAAGGGAAAAAGDHHGHSHDGSEGHGHSHGAPETWAPVRTAEALRDVDYVLVYCSAHWCPPCKGFTPILSEWSARLGPKLRCATVFASSDHGPSDFAGYFGSMSFDLALPFGDPTIELLSQHFGVRGIPTLLVLDARTGELVTDDGRSGVMADKEGARFPWRPRKLGDVLAEIDAGGQILDPKSGVPVPAGYLAGLDHVALYFSAHWCGPCRGFTPQLAAWYEAHVADGALTEQGKRFDILFVSSDKDEAAFDGYRKEMPWKAVSFANRDAKAALSKICDVEGIPTLALVNMRGGAGGSTPEVVTTDLRSKIIKRPDAFPWGPEPSSALEEAVDQINELPTLVLFTDALTDAAAEVAVTEAFRAVAAEHFDSASGKPRGALRFAVCAEGDGAADGVRKFLGVKDKDGPAACRLELIDIKGQRRATLDKAAATVPTVEAIRAFAADFVSGSITWGKLK